MRYHGNKIWPDEGTNERTDEPTNGITGQPEDITASPILSDGEGTNSRPRPGTIPTDASGRRNQGFDSQVRPEVQRSSQGSLTLKST